MVKKRASKEELLNTVCEHCKKTIRECKHKKRYYINGNKYLCTLCYWRMITRLRSERKKELTNIPPEELLKIVKNDI